MASSPSVSRGQSHLRSQPEKPSDNSRQPSDTTIGAALFCLLFAIYLLTFNGLLRSIEDLRLFATAESIWRGWWPALPQLEFAPYHNLTSPIEIGFALAALPFYGLSLVSDNFGSEHTFLLGNIFFSALLGPTMFLLFRSGGASRRQAILLTILFGAGTLMWPWSRSANRASLLALLYAVAFLGIVRFDQTKRGLWTIVTLIALLLATGVKAVAFIAIPFFLAPIVWWLYQQRPHTALTLGAVAVATSFVVLSVALSNRGSNVDILWYYLSILLSSEVLEALPVRVYGLLLSPGKGLFIYSPVLFAGLVGALLWARRGQWQGWVVLGVLLAHLVAYPIIYGIGWGGGLYWGPRYLVPIVPLIAFPIVEFVRSKPGRILLILLGLPSIAIQVVASTADWGSYWHELLTTVPGQPEHYLENNVLLDLRNFYLSPVVGQFLTWLPSNFDVLWLRPILAGGEAVLDLPLLLVLLTLLAVAVAFLAYALQPRPWREARLSLLGITLAFIAGTGVFLSRAHSVPSSYPEVDTPSLRTVAEEINSFSGRKLVLSVSNIFEYNAFMNFLKGDFTHYWFSPVQEEGLDILQGTVVEAERIFLVTDSIVPGSESSDLERWLNREAFRYDAKWIGPYVLFQYGPPQAMTLRKPAGQEWPGIALVEFAQGSLRAKAGQVLPLEFAFRATEDLKEDYTFFVHLIRADGFVLDGEDAPPQYGAAPTSSWEVGQAVRDRRALFIPPDLEEGEYFIEIGFTRDGERIPVLFGEGMMDRRTFIVSRIYVERSS